MVDPQHVAEMIVGAGINIFVAVKVLNARFDALHERMKSCEDETTRAHERIDNLLLKVR